MNFYIYFSGLLSAFSMIAWISMLLIGNDRAYLFLLAFLLFFIGFFLPISLVKRRRHREKMREIIRNYKESGDPKVQNKPGENTTEGWSMNNSPFRERKSGLNWGGGNIHALNATRGKRKSFGKR